MSQIQNCRFQIIAPLQIVSEVSEDKVYRPLYSFPNFLIIHTCAQKIDIIEISNIQGICERMQLKVINRLIEV